MVVVVVVVVGWWCFFFGGRMSVAGVSLSPAHTEVNGSEVRRQGTDGCTQDIVSSRAGYAASWTALLTETD